MSPPKSCAVCGDKALGYNFNAVTCESCKAFFRRNALAKKQFTCPFNQNCEITVVTRRFCQKCRLKKCLDIGMKSENIMSEEDKLIKRRKIENNRAKRRLNEKKQAAADSTGFDTTSHDSQSSYDSGKGTGTASAPCVDATQEVKPSSVAAATTTALLDEPLQDVNPELMSGDEMVDFIVSDPDRASQAINNLMRTPKEAMATLEKIINSQKDALRLISHLIAYPGDALKIISKIMNSPFNALTVFTKFMSSPTDALEIISKIVSSPQDVLQFIKNLMDCPEDALDIMNKFMNTPAEALRIINKLFNGSTPTGNANVNELLQSPPITMDTETSPFQSPITPQSQIHSPQGDTENPNTIIYSMLNSSPNSSLQPPSQQSSVASQAPTTTVNHHATTPPTIAMSPFTPSPQAMSIASPLSVATSDMHYNSPASISNDELPSTSAGLIASSTSPPAHTAATTTSTTTDITTDATDFASEHFDIKTFIQNSIPDHSGGSDSLNSLDSVLTEVIRIEFQAFNNLSQQTRVKQEQHHQHGMHTSQHCGYNAAGEQVQQQQQRSICTPSIIIRGRDLNEAEQMKLRELKLASEALFYPVDEDLSIFMMGDDRIKHEDTRQDPKLLQVINLTAVAIKRLIKMAKKITPFRDMCQEDQVALLKGGCTEMMIMRSVMTYDDDRNMWKIPHKKDSAHIRAEILKLAKGNVYEEHLKFIRTFHEKWRLDENIILIMMAILLFMPTRQRIIHSDVIRLEQNSYYYLLRRYLESVYPGCEAKSAFIKLIEKISDVERLNQVIIGVYLNVNPSLVEPLLREIFDLKNH